MIDLGIAIYDPNTGGANGTGRTPFPGETIPAGRISAPVKNLLAALPMPNLTPTNPAAPNYDASGVEQFDTRQFDLRADHYLRASFVILSDIVIWARRSTRQDHSVYTAASRSAYGMSPAPRMI